MREKTQLLIYDDDCGFCTQSALFLEQHADIELVPFSKVSDDELEFLESNWRDCAHLVTDDTVYSCGEAMERAFEMTDQPLSQIPPIARRFPGYAFIRNGVYHWIANHRRFVGKLVRYIS